MIQPFILSTLLIVGALQSCSAIQCRQCLSISGDLVSDCFPPQVPPKPPTDKPMGSVEIDDDLTAITISTNDDSNSNNTIMKDIDSSENVSASSGETTNTNTSATSFTLCGKSVYYLRRGNWVGRIVALFGINKNLTSHNINDKQQEEKKEMSIERSGEEDVGPNDNSSGDRSAEDSGALSQQQQENDGACVYFNEDSPVIDQVAANLKLDAFTYLVGVKRCFCEDDFCNGDPLLR